MNASLSSADIETLLGEMDEICNFATAEQKSFVRRLVKHNITGGKMSRARLTLQTCMACSPTHARSYAARVSLVNELLQGSFIVFDDLMDNSEYRRQKRCWHKIRGTMAMRDAYFIFALCKKYLRHLHADAALKPFSEVAFRTSLGQVLDTLVSDFSLSIGIDRRYSASTYRQICINKNAYYTFYFPVKLGLLLGGQEEPENLRVFAETCGYLHQIQDDYLDFFPEKSGKAPNDLRERKCTWFVCQIVEEHGHNDEVLRQYIETGCEAAMMRRIESLYARFFAKEAELLRALRTMCDGEHMHVYATCLGMLDKRRC